MMRGIYIKIPKLNKFYNAGIFLLAIKVVLSGSHILPYHSLIDSALSITASFFVIFSILQQRPKRQEAVFISLIVLLGLWTSFQIGNLSILLTILVCIAAHYHSYDETIELILSYEGICLGIHTILSVFFACIGHSNWTKVNGIWHYNFGFGHPNAFSCLVVNILFMWSWLHFGQMTWKTAGRITLVTVFVFLFTGTRTTLLVGIVFFLLFYIVKYMGFKLSRLAGAIVPISMIFTVVGFLLYLKDNVLMETIDTLFSSRIRLGAWWYQNSGFSILGQNLESISATWDEIWRLSGNVAFDNLYSYMSINIGILWLAVIVFSFFRLSIRKDGKANLFIIVWALYGLCEIHGLNPFMLFPVLFCANTAWYMIDEREEESDQGLLL